MWHPSDTDRREKRKRLNREAEERNARYRMASPLDLLLMKPRGEVETERLRIQLTETQRRLLRKRRAAWCMR